MKVKCYQCQYENIISDGKVFKSDTCEKCSADLHSCRACHFYDPKSYNECREPMAERIIEKEKANYCDYFKPGGGASNNNKTDDLVAKANALFKD